MEKKKVRVACYARYSTSMKTSTTDSPEETNAESEEESVPSITRDRFSTSTEVLRKVSPTPTMW